MIARFYYQLPFLFTMLKDYSYSQERVTIDGNEIIIYPPFENKACILTPIAQNILMDGCDTFNGNIIQIDFKNKSFTRTEEGIEKTIDLSRRVLNNYLSRLRVVTGSEKIKEIQSNCDLLLVYLNDDETELEQEEGLVRMQEGRRIATGDIVGINQEIWENFTKLDLNSKVPKWKTLLLDASSLIPDNGPAIVLAFTALEVFISSLLNEIAENSKDKELWDWLNNRGFYLKNPSIEEQYDFLSNHYLGFSLKESSSLWSDFKGIQKVRNDFVHSGNATLNGEPLNEANALYFIGKVSDIFSFYREKVPNEYKWDDYKIQVNFQASFPRIIIKKEL